MIHKNRHVFASKRRKNIKAPPIIRGRVLFLANFQEVKNSSNGTQVRRRLHINRGKREGSGLNGVVILRNRQSLAHLSAVAQSRPRILLLLREPRLSPRFCMTCHDANQGHVGRKKKGPKAWSSFLIDPKP